MFSTALAPMQTLAAASFVLTFVAAVAAGEALVGQDGGHSQMISTPRDVYSMMEDFFEEEEEREDEVDDVEQEEDTAFDEEQIVVDDPCRKLRCLAGRECRVDPETGEASCQCVSECGQETDPRRQVCSNHNETFSTDCDLHRLRCICEDEKDGCPDVEKYSYVHIEYYGECRLIPSCSTDELSDFPRRMREWLFNVMQELADRQELSHYYSDMEKQAEDDETKRWRNAAIWRWCDLDASPKDNAVSRHELFPVKAPLQALEHCIGDFLDACDDDDDHIISLKEWGKCLEIDEADLVDECEKLAEA